MTAKDWSREIAAASPFVKGVTVEVRGASAQTVPGVTNVVDGTVSGLASLADNSVDTILTIGGIEHSNDAIATLRQFRRAVREGGKVVLVVSRTAGKGGANHFSPPFVASLITHVGGFQVDSIDEVTPEETFIVVCVRSVVAEIRQPFGVHGPSMTEQINRNAAARSEYYFQIGTLMLQTGDPDFAIACFENVLADEPNNAEALFGLGMTLGTQSRWEEAQHALQRSHEIDPSNGEVERWIQLAREQRQKAAAQVDIPQVAPARGGVRSVPLVTPQGATATPASGAAGVGESSPTPKKTPVGKGLRL